MKKKSATRDVARLLGELKKDKVDNVLIDLRNNGGGSLNEAVELTGLFIDKGPVVLSSSRRHTRSLCDWSSDVCSSDLTMASIIGELFSAENLSLSHSSIFR